MRLEDIKPGLMVHALGEGGMNGAQGVHVGTVLEVSGQSGPEGHIAIAEGDGPDGPRRWIPIEWVDHTDDLAVYLNKTPEELRGAVLAMPDDPAPAEPSKAPPKPETAEGHTGRDDVSHGMNNNLDPSLAPPGADQAAAQDIQDQHRQTEDEAQD